MKIKATVFMFMLFVTSVFSVQSAIAAKRLIITGTGACESILEELALGFNKRNPGYKVIVPPSVGSGGGIKMVINDSTIIARVARTLKEKEAKQGLSYLVFAKDMIVFGVSGNKKISALTEEQLGDIFSGKITNWGQVDGDEGRIIVLHREQKDSSLAIIRKHMPSFREIKYGGKNSTSSYIPGAGLLLKRDSEMAAKLNSSRASIGWIPKSAIPIDPLFNMVAINGVAPTDENVRAGKYKLVGEFAFVYKEKRLDEFAKMFIDFVFSEPGRSILEKNSLIAVSR